MSHLERVTCELREDLQHERSRRLGLIDNVTRLSSERERDRSDFAFAQLENERAQCSLRDELVEARQDISRPCGEISELQTRADSQHREQKYLLEMLERKGFLHRKKSVLLIRPKATNVEHRMHAHLAWQFNRVRVA